MSLWCRHRTILKAAILAALTIPIILKMSSVSFVKRVSNRCRRFSFQSDLLENISQPFFYMTNPDFIFNSSQSYFRLRKSKLNALSEALHIPGDHICTVGGQPCVLFVVPSVADYYNAETRVVIRKTWASQFYGKNWLQTSNQRIAFFFGSLGLNAEMRKMLEIESKKYGDIVVAEYNDSYENLSYKMVKIISWVNVFCQGLEIMVKVDMDTFVNVDLLLTLAQTIPAETHPIYVFGHKHELKYPTVVRLGKWAVPEAVYHFHHFPEYIYGHSYVISGPAVKLLAESFPYFPIIPNEDVFITGVMSVVLNITRFHHTSFAHPRERRKWSSIMQNLYVTAIVNDEFRLKFFELFQARRVSKIRCKTLTCIFHYSL